MEQNHFNEEPGINACRAGWIYTCSSIDSGLRGIWRKMFQLKCCFWIPCRHLLWYIVITAWYLGQMFSI